VVEIARDLRVIFIISRTTNNPINVIFQSPLPSTTYYLLSTNSVLHSSNISGIVMASGEVKTKKA